MTAVPEIIDGLPDEWEVLKLGEAYEFSKKPRSLEIRDKDIVPFIPMDLISEGSKSVKGWQIKKMSEVTSGTFVLKNDLMIAKITPSFENGKQAILDNLPQDYGYATTEVWSIHPKNNHYLSDYLFNYIRIPEVRHSMATKMEGATGRQRLPRNVLESQLIAFPPLSEQKKIASVFLALQESKEKTENVLSALKELKKSMMKHLFTYGAVPIEQISSVKLKETDIGLMPEKWDSIILGDVCSLLQYGTSNRCDDDSSKTPVLRIPNIVNGRVYIADLKYMKPTDIEMVRLKLKVGDVVFVRTNGRRDRIGRCAIFNDELKECLFASYLIRAQLMMDKMLPAYLLYYTLTTQGRNYFEDKSSKAADGKYNINQQTIKNLPCPLPQLHEQQKIVNILSTIDGKIEAEENKKNSLDALFKTLLSLLMTGKMRVNNLEI